MPVGFFGESRMKQKKNEEKGKTHTASRLDTTGSMQRSSIERGKNGEKNENEIPVHQVFFSSSLLRFSFVILLCVFFPAYPFASSSVFMREDLISFVFILFFVVVLSLFTSFFDTPENNSFAMFGVAACIVSGWRERRKEEEKKSEQKYHTCVCVYAESIGKEFLILERFRSGAIIITIWVTLLRMRKKNRREHAY